MIDSIGKPVVIRVYGKILNRWSHINDSGREVATQYEVAYKEYNTETLELVGVGSEDFSPIRYSKEIKRQEVFTWDGERRNKGGNRWFEDRGGITYRKSERKAVMDYLKRLYNAELVQLRY